MSYLKVQFSAAINGQSFFLIDKSKITLIKPGDQAGANFTTATTVVVDTGVAGSDLITFTHTAAAAGYSVVDSFSEAWSSNPGGILAKVAGVPAVLNAQLQATSFVQFTAWAEN